MTRDTIAAALMIWLIGAILGWCAGWTARGEQHHAGHRDLVCQLAQVRQELAETLDDLDRARGQCQATRVHPPAPAVVHLHVDVATPLPWPATRPIASDTTRFLDAMPVLPAQEGQS